MKVLTIGDPHFKVGNALESEQMTENLVEIVQEHQPDFVVCLGDILHRHETIHVSPLMRAEEMIKQLSQLVPTFLIIGNHDRPNNSDFLSDRHPFNALKEWNNTYIVDRVMDVTLQDDNDNNYRFLFVPYVPPGKFMEALETKDQPLEGTTAIFAHQEFLGAQMGAIKSQVGDEWLTTWPFVISGHIHDYQRLQSNVTYVGTPFQHGFGDSAQKTVSVFTFNYVDGELKVEEDRIDLGLKKRVIIYLAPSEIHTFSPPVDKIVKVVIKGKESEIKAVAKLEKIKQLKKSGVKIAFKTIQENLLTDSDAPEQVHISYSDRLYQTVKTEPQQLEWYNQLFVK